MKIEMIHPLYFCIEKGQATEKQKRNLYCIKLFYNIYHSHFNYISFEILHFIFIISPFLFFFFFLVIAVYPLIYIDNFVFMITKVVEIYRCKIDFILIYIAIVISLFLRKKEKYVQYTIFNKNDQRSSIYSYNYNNIMVTHND